MIAGTLYIRADASSKIGFGHVMRCFSLAQSWKKKGGKVVFIGSFDSDVLLERMKEEGFFSFLLPDSRSVDTDLSTIQKQVKGEGRHPGSNWLVLDGYQFDEIYQQEVAEVGIPVLVVDDNHHLTRYYADALLNPNVYASRIDYHALPHTVFLLGGKYSLLRAEFGLWENWNREIAPNATRICVTMGGADTENVTGKVLKSLAKTSMMDLDVRVVVGPANQHMETLEQMVCSLPYSIKLLQGVKDMPGLMAWADMAVSAAGGTCLELACLGTPTLTIITADNQETNAGVFAENGIFPTMGWWHSFSEDELAQVVLSMAEDHKQRLASSVKGRRLITSSGADNCISALLAFSPETKRVV